MPAELNFFDTYTLMAVYKRVVPKKTFFRDRYFPTSDEDIFASNKVLTEYMDGDQKMAAFVAPRVGAIPMERIPKRPSCAGPMAPSVICVSTAPPSRRAALQKPIPATRAFPMKAPPTRPFTSTACATTTATPST